MYTPDFCLLVIGAFAIARSTAIRVDWNTNTGPIVPPVPTTTQRPQPPFREPAPVWEDQSNDIPNPNPYVYVLPPPSRPRPATNNYLTSDIYYGNNKNGYNSNNNNNRQYGHIVLPHQVNAYLQQNTNNNNNNNNLYVASLSPKYIPNVGIKYAAIISSSSPSSSPTNGIYTSAKPQGRYNPKTKKYKAYQKSKYVPINYYATYDSTPNEPYAVVDEAPQQKPQLEEYLLLQQQQLPLAQPAVAFRPIEVATAKVKKFSHDKDLTGAPQKSKRYTQAPLTR